MWLKKEEEQWCLKKRALWIKVGDNNTKLFHQFLKFRKNVNTIWEVKVVNKGITRFFKEKV
jgi:hypothetical protein